MTVRSCGFNSFTSAADYLNDEGHCYNAVELRLIPREQTSEIIGKPHLKSTVRGRPPACLAMEFLPVG